MKSVRVRVAGRHAIRSVSLSIRSDGMRAAGAVPQRGCADAGSKNISENSAPVRGRCLKSHRSPMAFYLLRHLQNAIRTNRGGFMKRRGCVAALLVLALSASGAWAQGTARVE